MMSMNLNGFFNLNIKDVDYHCFISRISKSEAINLIQNTNLNEESETLKKIKSCFYIYKKVKRF